MLSTGIERSNAMHQIPRYSSPLVIQESRTCQYLSMFIEADDNAQSLGRLWSPLCLLHLAQYYLQENHYQWSFQVPCNLQISAITFREVWKITACGKRNKVPPYHWLLLNWDTKAAFRTNTRAAQCFPIDFTSLDAIQAFCSGSALSQFQQNSFKYSWATSQVNTVMIT